MPEISISWAHCYSLFVHENNHMEFDEKCMCFLVYSVKMNKMSIVLFTFNWKCDIINAIKRFCWRGVYGK